MRHGLGRMVYFNGEIEDGIWEKNKFKEPIEEKTPR